jgi:hypothetical protein
MVTPTNGGESSGNRGCGDDARDTRCSLRRPGFLAQASLGLGLTLAMTSASSTARDTRTVWGSLFHITLERRAALNQILMIHAKAAEPTGEFMVSSGVIDRAGMRRCSGPPLTR